MKVTIEIPDFKFSVGDIVQLPNTRNSKSIYFRIANAVNSGGWAVDLVGGWVRTREDVPAALSNTGPLTSALYYGFVVGDSWHDCQPAEKWTGSTYLAISKEELEQRGVLQND